MKQLGCLAAIVFIIALIISGIGIPLLAAAGSFIGVPALIIILIIAAITKMRG